MNESTPPDPRQPSRTQQTLAVPQTSMTCQPSGPEHTKLVVSDAHGRVFSHPYLSLAGRSGDRPALPLPSELVPLPKGSQLFTLPGRVPFGYEEEGDSFVLADKVQKGRGTSPVMAVAAFLPPGYVRTLLPATKRQQDAPVLPLWAYAAVGWKRNRFWVPGLLIDPNPHWHPRYFQNDGLLEKRVRGLLLKNPANRLLLQLSRCALEYHCFAAKNVFFRRWECPLPTAPSCNADCVGCISLQPSECCPASQERIRFVPSVDEVVDVAWPHLEEAEDPIVSFGQGCEGEPLTQWRTLERSIRRVRDKTDRGTINLNTNGSFPKRVRILCDAGLDSIRVTLNSAHPKPYESYHRPKGYRFRDVVEALLVAKEKGVYTSINLLVFPGVTDRVKEVEGLIRLIAKTGLDLIQLRNLNIDPDLYLDLMGKGEGIGIPRMIEILRQEFPRLQLGYFNRTRETFFVDPSSRWPIPTGEPRP